MSYRCTDRFTLSFEKQVNTALADGEDDGESDEANYIDGYHLDVEQLLYNEILVGWPMKVLCSEDCKGDLQCMWSELE